MSVPLPSPLSDVSVVVLSHNRHDALMVNLESLVRAQAANGFELIVVDNASTDGSRAALRELAARSPGLRLHLDPENLGVARGRNRGWSLSTRDFILNLDDDTAIDAEGIGRLRDVACSDPRIGIVTPQVVEASNGVLLNDYVLSIREPATFAGACHLLRRAVWERTGELDPRCSFGGEELDYTIRARAQGFVTRCVPEVVVRHHGMMRPAAVGRARRARWLYNYTRVQFKHFPLHRAGVLALRSLVAHCGTGIRAHGPAILGPLLAGGLRGLIDGRRSYQALPREVLAFYADPQLRPDFGQVPLLTKLRGRGRSRRQAPLPSAGAPS